ncbi:hypothetical protein ACQW08_01770 [Gluconobacter japonicus]|uniref:hypothetical protein n=1 Tax=Gluconobacter japonicus TaxID=376620 RepID=UPI003D293D07
MEIYKKISEQYSNVGKLFHEYWEIYGGYISLITSPYFHLALLISIFSWNSWTKPDWWDTAISVLPSLVSFTLAGYAMLTALGDDSFRKKMAVTNRPGEPSVFMQVSTTFAHFITIQTIALLLAIFCKSRPLATIDLILNHYISSNFNSTALIFVSRSFWLISYCFFVYSCVLVFSCTMAVFRSTKWLNYFLRVNGKNQGKQETVSPTDPSQPKN